jgi:hypothetical protein
MSLTKLTEIYPELKVQITGSFALMMRLADDISKNQFKSLAIAAVVISLLMMLTLGSLQAGVMSIIPNLIPATLAFGLMGLLRHFAGYRYAHDCTFNYWYCRSMIQFTLLVITECHSLKTTI